jgi:hypothetical protein
VREAPADWRQRAAVALAHAEAMDGQVRQLLTFDDLPSAESSATNATRTTNANSATSAPPVMSTFTSLWDVVHAPAGGPASR